MNPHFNKLFKIIHLTFKITYSFNHRFIYIIQYLTK